MATLDGRPLGSYPAALESLRGGADRLTVDPTSSVDVRFGETDEAVFGLGVNRLTANRPVRLVIELRSRSGAVVFSTVVDLPKAGARAVAMRLTQPVNASRAASVLLERRARACPDRGPASAGPDCTLDRLHPSDAELSLKRALEATPAPTTLAGEGQCSRRRSAVAAMAATGTSGRSRTVPRPPVPRLLPSDAPARLLRRRRGDRRFPARPGGLRQPPPDNLDSWRQQF